jgi:hypothetical protein
MRIPPVVRYDARLTEAAPAVSWGEIDEGEPVGDARPIAWWGRRVVGVETDGTVWLGTREGASLHAIFPRLSAHRTTEPCNPFPGELPDRYESHRPYAEALGYAARKAGVGRVATFARDGRLPMNLEVLPRVDPDGTLMVIAINHDDTDAAYDVTIDRAYVPAGAEAWDLLMASRIEAETDGRFRTPVAPWGVSIVLIGSPARLAPIKEGQAQLASRDLGVPAYFLERPELNQDPWNTRVPPLEP